MPESVRKELAALAAMPESEIDFSDLPPLQTQEWVGAERGKFYRPIKQQLTNMPSSLDPFPVYRIDPIGQLTRLGVMTAPTRPDVFVMHQDDGRILSSEGLPWWLLDMRPQGFLGRAFAGRHASALGLPASVNEWSDSQALRALLQQGHDTVGNLFLGDEAHRQWQMPL